MSSKLSVVIDKFFNKIPGLKLFLQKTGLRDTREDEEEYRTIYINNVKPDGYIGEVPLKYGDNEIITSKYTIFNFLPKNLFEQFRRIANFYFLINALLLSATPEPPKSPFIAIIPLLVVVTFTAIKQAYEDVLRHRSDAEVNFASAKVLRDGEFKSIKRKDILCGDIVEVKSNNAFPCDLLLLYCPTDDCVCHITTANLDGETNLKPRSVPDKLPFIKDYREISNYRGVIKCDKPNDELYEFKGKIEINNIEYPLRAENILLRGATLKISPFIYGCAIYTGKDTKIMLNSKYKPSKLSCIERTLNSFIVYFLILLMIMTVACLLGSIVFNNFYKKNWYMRNLEPKFFSNQRTLYYFIEFMFYLSLFSNVIPISMYISIETQKFLGSKFFEWDLNMYNEKSNQPAKSNTSDINEDLGQIEYLFSDKTGTLTENEMIFKQFFLDGVIYEFKNGGIYRLGSNFRMDLRIQELNRMKFFEVLCLCHTVILDVSAKEQYQASSPDEFSFVKFCEQIGVVYLGDSKITSISDTNKIRSFRLLNTVRQYILLHVFEFDSDRKRMSVIVKCLQTNRLILFCKGAENSIFAKCVSGDIKNCNSVIDEFAEQGWRTLALAYKILDEREYESYSMELEDAYNDLNNREEKLSQLYDKIESNLILIGSTAVEDRLQEDVPNTLETLRRGGIKIWILTGDKKETAVNISESCKHFSYDMQRLFLTDYKMPEVIAKELKNHEKILRKESDRKSFAYIVDGKTIGNIFKYKLTKEFQMVGMKCDAVLCCRMSPRQKAQVVKLVKNSESKPITCAIGDGANDVSMIQEAHVGLGIFGKEGRNAARAADFAFSKFKYIKRALLIHGFLYYTRLTSLVHYFFYKNIAFVLCQLYHAFFTAFSVQSIYHSIFIIFYNIAFTSFPIIVFGLFEQKRKIKELEQSPKLYKTISRNKMLSFGQFFKWNILGVWHSLVAYFSAWFLSSDSFLSPKGLTGGHNEFGALVFIQVIIIVHVKLLTELSYVTYYTVLSYFLSILGFVIFCLIPNSFITSYPFTVFTEDQNFFWIIYQLFSYPVTWFCFLASAVIAIIPDLTIKIFENLKEELEIRKEENKYSNSKSLNDLPRNFSERKRKRFDLCSKKRSCFPIKDKKTDEYF